MLTILAVWGKHVDWPKSLGSEAMNARNVTSPQPEA
jgi:hypothetical protein